MGGVDRREMNLENTLGKGDLYEKRNKKLNSSR